MSKRRSRSTYNLVYRAQVVISNWNHRSSHVVSMKSVSKANPRVWLSMGWVESCHRNLNSHFKASKPSVLFIPAHQRVGIKFSLNIRICLKFSDRSAIKIMKNYDNWTWGLSCANFVKFPRLHIRISMAKVHITFLVLVNSHWISTNIIYTHMSFDEYVRLWL